MKLNWELLLNDSGQFPRTFFFEEASSERFRYGINEHLQYCLYLHLPEYAGNQPIEPVILANVSLVEEVVERKNTLILTLLNDRCKNLFGDLILNIVTQSNTFGDKNIKQGFIGICNEWFDLFDPPASGLRKEEVQGIFAELDFLRFLLLNSKFSYNEVISSWKGPYGKGHDFELGENHFEIKGIAEHRSMVAISSEYQLDFIQSQNLFLIVYGFATSNNTGTSLNELVTEIAATLRSRTATNMKLFWTALGKVGISNNNAKDYDHYLFIVLSNTYYDCTSAGFPSIKRSFIPDAIRNVKYELSLGALLSYKKDDLTLHI